MGIPWGGEKKQCGLNRPAGVVLLLAPAPPSAAMIRPSVSR
ncbi:hypothetical protein ACQ9BS_00010 [Streptomyces lividans]